MPARSTLAAAAFPLLLGSLSCAKIESRDLIREGNAAYAEARFADAIELYTQAEQLEPDGVTLFWNRACAAESLVLKIKDPKDHEARKKYADMALADFQTWFDRLEEKNDAEAKQLHDHRLALLDADERCDDLLTYWMEKLRANPREEGLYGVIARQYERCGNLPKADEWHVKRTADFPESVRAWHSLAIRRFEPLWPDPESGLPYNDALSGNERLTHADSVIELLDRATAIDAKFRDAYTWRAMAYTQRALSRAVIDPALLPEEKLEAIRAREDAMLAWKQQKAVCDLEELPDCPVDKVPDSPCCPPPPISAEDRDKDAVLKKQVEDELAAAAEKANRKKRKGR